MARGGAQGMGDFVTNEYVVFDGTGVKASLQQLATRPDAWVWYTPAASEDTATLRNYYRAVPWLWRGTALRADAVGSMPFDIVTPDGAIYDTSEDWQNRVGFMEDPESLFWIIEAALTLQPAVYLFRETVGSSTINLRYLLADSITPDIDSRKGLLGFERRVGQATFYFTPEQLVYFWQADPFTEFGPAENSSPGHAAVAASGVLFNVDEFAAKFFERGAIKAQLLKVPAGTPEVERKRAETWWRRVFSGIGNAWSTRVVSEGTEVQEIGQGVSELSDSQLSREKREDIATALGIPMTLLWSSEAGGLGGGGVVSQDDKHFYGKTVVPQCNYIARVMNRQVFVPMGLRLAFRPETLDVFQTDENQRAQSFSAYVNAGLRRSLVAEMLGLELPEGIEYEDLDEQYEEDREARMPDFSPFSGNGDQDNQPPNANQEAMRADLRKWRTKARKADGPVPFESEFIPPALKASIEGSIEELGVDAAFEFLTVKKKTRTH